MTALDTNVLVRFLVQDDPAQGARASALMATLTPEAPGHVCREVMVELVWVLERAYRFGRAEVAATLDALLEAEELVIEADDRVGLAVSRYRRGGPGFADQMILLAAGQAGGQAGGQIGGQTGRQTGGTLCTFDRALGQLPGARLV